MKISPLTSRSIVVAAVAGALLAPAAADAKVRWAKPGGATSGNCATTGSACRVDFALSGAVADDEVVLLPGTYDVSAHPLDIDKTLNVHGFGNQRPIITSASTNAPVLTVDSAAAGSTISNLDIRGPQTQPLTTVISYANDARLQNLAIRGDAINLRLIDGINQTIEDVTATSTGSGDKTSIIAETPGTTLRRVKAIVLSPNGTGVELAGEGSSAEDLYVSSLGRGVILAGTEGGPTLEVNRARIYSSFTAASAGGPVQITNSFLRTTATGGIAAIARTGAALQLRHVTAVTLGDSAWAAQATGAPSNGSPATLTVRNSIIRGTEGSVLAGPGGAGSNSGKASIAYSNVNSFSASVKTGQGLQGDDPKFVDPNAGDFRIQTGSPAIDAGADDPANGATDYYGNERKQGAAVDLGAFEATPGQDPAPLPAGDPIPDDPAPGGGSSGSTGSGGSAGPGGSGAGEGGVGGSADRTVPVLSSVSLTRRTFVVASRSTPVAARRKKGTVLRYRLSEAGTVTVTIHRQVTRKGKRKYVSVGALTRRSQGGAGTIAFSGRIGKKKLAVGNYRAVVMATDRAGNRSKSKTLSFKIVKR